MLNLLIGGKVKTPLLAGTTGTFSYNGTTENFNPETETTLSFISENDEAENVKVSITGVEGYNDLIDTTLISGEGTRLKATSTHTISLDEIIYNATQTVKVTDGETPLENASVAYIFGSQTGTQNTLADGTTTINLTNVETDDNNITFPQYTIDATANKDGHPETSKTFTLDNLKFNPETNDTIQIEMGQVPDEFWVTGNVTLENNATPENDITVKGWENGEMLINTTVSDGTYTTAKLNENPENGLDSLKFESTGYVPEVFYDVALTANEATTQNATLEEITNPPEDKYAIIWHKAVQDNSISQPGTRFDVEITGPNHTKTFTVNNGEWYRDTILTQEGVTVNCTIEYTPHIKEGGIPLYPRTINLTIPEGTTHIDRDTSYAAKKQKIKGWVKKLEFDGSNPYTTGQYTYTVSDFNNNVLKQETVNGGEPYSYEYNVGPEGTGPEIKFTFKLEDGSESANYFGIKDYPATTLTMSETDKINFANGGGIYKGRPMELAEKIKEWSDTLLTANILLTPKHLLALYDNVTITADKVHIRAMESNGINHPKAMGNERVYLSGMNETDYLAALQDARDRFGDYFNETYVSSASEIVNDGSNYTIANPSPSVGWIRTQGANYTVPVNAYDKGLSLIIGGDMLVSAYPSERSAFYREMAVRAGGIQTFPTSIRTNSIANDVNSATDADAYDQAYIRTFFEHRKYQTDVTDPAFNNLGYLDD